MWFEWFTFESNLFCGIEFYLLTITGILACHITDILLFLLIRTTNVMQHVAFVFITLCGSTLHVSGALCTHHQECIWTGHAGYGTIVIWYGVRAGWLGGNPESGTNRTILWPCYVELQHTYASFMIITTKFAVIMIKSRKTRVAQHVERLKDIIWYTGWQQCPVSCYVCQMFNNLWQSCLRLPYVIRSIRNDLLVAPHIRRPISAMILQSSRH